MERQIEHKKIDKKQFKTYCLDKISILVSKYRFYYSGVIVKTEKDLFEYVKKRDQRGRLTLYYHLPSKRLFMIIYCKNRVELAYTDLSISTARKYNKEFSELQKEIKSNIEF